MTILLILNTLFIYHAHLVDKFIQLTLISFKLLSVIIMFGKVNIYLLIYIHLHILLGWLGGSNSSVVFRGIQLTLISFKHLSIIITFGKINIYLHIHTHFHISLIIHCSRAWYCSQYCSTKFGGSFEGGIVSLPSMVIW